MGKTILTSSSDVIMATLWIVGLVLSSFPPAFSPCLLPCCLWLMLACLQTAVLVPLSFCSARPAKPSSVMDSLSLSASFEPLLTGWGDCCWVLIVFLLSLLSKEHHFRIGLGQGSTLPWTSHPVLMWGVSGPWQESCGCRWDQRCCTSACCSSASSSWWWKCSILAILSVGWSSMPSLLSHQCCQVSVLLQAWNHSSRRASSSTQGWSMQLWLLL